MAGDGGDGGGGSGADGSDRVITEPNASPINAAKMVEARETDIAVVPAQAGTQFG